VRAEVDEVCDGLAGTSRSSVISPGPAPAIFVEAGPGPAVGAGRSSPLPVRVQTRADGRLPATAKQPRITFAAGAFHRRETRG
jgi:hypothetical protein